MKSKKFKSLLAGTMLMLSFVAFIPMETSAQKGPIKFQYSSDLDWSYEGGKLYATSTCEIYEGNSCTHPGSRHRIEVPVLK